MNIELPSLFPKREPKPSLIPEKKQKSAVDLLSSILFSPLRKYEPRKNMSFNCVVDENGVPVWDFIREQLDECRVAGCTVTITGSHVYIQSPLELTNSNEH